MGFEEFVAWIRELAERGHLTPDQAEDVIRQRALFDERRPTLEVEYGGLAVGFIEDELHVGRGISALLDDVTEGYHGERQLYFEEISPAARFGMQP